MAIDNDLELIRKLPKVELHWHLDGSIRAETAIDLARKNDIALPTYDPETLYPPGYDQDTFLRTLFAVCPVIATPDDYRRVAFEAISDGVAAGNVRYAELFFQATAHPAMSYPEMIAGLVEGIRDAEQATGVRCGLIAGINRGEDTSVAVELVQNMLAHPHEKVIGIGIDGDNFVGPAAKFVEAFDLAERHGLHRTAHAGLPLEDTADALDLLHCERIDHGYYVLRNRELLERVVEQRIHHTACWTCASYYFDTTPEASPIQGMIEAQVSTSINTDDPSLFHTDIGEEYVRAAQNLGWDVETAFARVLDAIDGAFLPECERAQLRTQLTLEKDSLIAAAGQSESPTGNSR
ncbi:adenosine deaminase [Nocardia miyunensis]|uniref:adenosine deaminase n=1 Tax=Nocardia miyunensis TaxID=282684 RepID=UPI00082FCF68|nr:adenosine deaminase [Nocardia miyunensis]